MPTLQPLRLSINAMMMSLTVLSCCIALTTLLVPFLSIDRQFNILWEISLHNVRASFDPVMIDAIRNSILLSSLASFTAILSGTSVVRLLKRWPFLIGGLLLFVYTVNPITRALSFGDLFHYYTPFAKWMEWLCGEWTAQMILIPSLVLGAHYLPMYLLRFLFVIRKPTISHTLTGLFDFCFVTLPAFLRGFPISFSLFFLLTFFDYWVIQVMSGGKALYWSQMFEQKAFVARDIGEAGTLIVLGLLLTVAAYLVTTLLTRILLYLLTFVRPLSLQRFAHFSLPRALTLSFDACIVFMLSWPLLFSVLRLLRVNWHQSTLLIDGGERAIILTLILSVAIASLSTLLAFLLSTFFREHSTKGRWWLFSLYFLALVPEAAYVLFSLCVTGSGLLKGSPWWLALLMISFTAPMSFFLFESLWGESEVRKLWMLAPSLTSRFGDSLMLAFSEWKRFFLLTFAINLWMTTDNVFITNFAAGPKWKPLSATIFTATKRGFSDAEFVTGVLGSLSVLFLILLLIYSLPKENSIEHNS